LDRGAAYVAEARLAAGRGGSAGRGLHLPGVAPLAPAASGRIGRTLALGHAAATSGRGRMARRPRFVSWPHRQRGRDSAP